MISFIMPAKNASPYIKDAISVLQQAANWEWELIVVEDHSGDDTLAILREIENADDRIKVFLNPGTGKVQGLNYGYSQTKGDLIKCIDADDILDSDFFVSLCTINDFDAMCHDSFIVDSKKNVLGRYSADKTILNRDFQFCLFCLKSLPRWTWTFTREMGDKIFPMPEDLPFEDVWFSLIIKKYAKKVEHINKPLYYYRQHSKQTYGGILNFNYDILSFRAKRLLKMIEVIRTEPSQRLLCGIETGNLFNTVIEFNTLIGKKKLEIAEILFSTLPLTFKIKLLIYRKLTWIAPLILKMKWLWDKKQA